jgi:hypothetical protein
MEAFIGRTNQSLDDYLLTGNAFYKNERASFWRHDYQMLLDSMLAAGNRVKNPAVAATVYDFIIKAARLKTIQDRIEQDYELSADTLSGDLLHITRQQTAESMGANTENLYTSLELISKIEENAAASTLENIAFTFEQMPRVAFVISIIVVLIAASIATHIINSIFSKLRLIKSKIRELEQGNLPAPIPPATDELDAVAKGINNLSENLGRVSQFASQVGNNNLDSELTAFDSESLIGQSLIQMRDSLKKLALEEEERAWIANGITVFADLIRQNSHDQVLLCESFISKLVSYLEINQGCVYMLDEEQAQPTLTLRAAYAYQQQRYQDHTILVGEGLIGETFRENRSRFLIEVPENYIRITSGIGESLPKCLLIVPIRANEKVGVLELASFHPLTEAERNFTEKVAELLAATVITLRTTENTRRLLEKAQISGEMMRIQEEEMRQNMEELQTTQEEMRRKESELVRLLQYSTEREKELEAHVEALTQLRNDRDRMAQELLEQKNQETVKLQDALLTQKKAIESIFLKHKQESDALKARIAELEQAQQSPPKHE